MKQQIGHGRITPFQGALMVAGILLAFLVVTLLLNLLEQATGLLYGKVVLWAIGICVATWMLFRFVRCFEYELTGFDLKIHRIYGNRKKLMANAVLRTVRYYGVPEEAKKRYPHTRVYRAVYAKCPYPAYCVAYETGGVMVRLILQPDPQFRAQLDAALKETLRKG